jgi:anaerobic selenocysteine-containing dehydrogenase
MALEERASVCTFDCPDTYSLSVSIEEGRVVKVRGSNAVPYTAGVICNKVAREMIDFVHAPRRLLYPLRRIGPKGPASSSEFRGKPRSIRSMSASARLSANGDFKR